MKTDTCDTHERSAEEHMAEAAKKWCPKIQWKPMDKKGRIVGTITGSADCSDFSVMIETVPLKNTGGSFDIVITIYNDTLGTRAHWERNPFACSPDMRLSGWGRVFRRVGFLVTKLYRDERRAINHVNRPQT